MVTLTSEQLKTIPSAGFVRKYGGKFDGGEKAELELASIHELDILKYSRDPEVRKLHYQVYSQSVPNAEILLQLNNLRH